MTNGPVTLASKSIGDEGEFDQAEEALEQVASDLGGETTASTIRPDARLDSIEEEKGGSRREYVST